MKENWLTQKPQHLAWVGVFLLTGAVVVLTLFDWSNPEVLSLGFRATWSSVFEKHQYYQLWTSLFVHADSSHTLSNLILFVPLLYLLSAYFGNWLWPFFALFIGGAINAIVLQTLPPDVALIGISGVDNWLGAVWLTLFFLIDRRENRRRRFAVVLFVTFVLFVPDTYKPGISYLSHFIGYVLGVLSGLLFFYWRKDQFQKAEVFEIVIEEDPLPSTL